MENSTNYEEGKLKSLTESEKIRYNRQMKLLEIAQILKKEN